MKIGKLRHRITIQQLTRTPDGSGGYTETWPTFSTVWASINPVHGKELFEAQQIQSNVTHKIRIRYLSGVKSSMRVSFESRIFQIQSVINWEEHDREMMLECSEVVS